MLSKRAKSITPSMTLGTINKIKQMKSDGYEIINLSLGEPDFFTPQKASKSAKLAIDNNKTKYDLVPGLIELRKSICNKLLKENNISYTADEIVVSSGGKHAITNTLIALLDYGDEVLLPKPYWVSYPEMIKLVGGVPVAIETKKQNNFKLTPEELQEAISDKIKLLIISNPSNPTGAVYTKDELQEIVQICIDKDIYILSDELYERICYIDEYTSIASISEEAKNITITVNGFSKSAAMTGWRLGYTACNKELAKAISSIQGHLVSHPSTISQWAGLEILNSCEHDIDEMVLVYRTRRNEAIELLNSIPEISFVQPDGAFYIFIDMSSLKDKLEYKDSFSLEVANKLLVDYHVAVVAGIAFGNDEYIRISYATDMNTIKQGIAKIKQFIDDVNKE